MSFPEIEAFAQECTAAEETLAQVPAAAWGQVALGQWTLAQLTAHFVRGATRITEYLPLPAEGDPVVDRVGYYRYDPDVQSPGVAKRAIDEAVGVTPEEFVGRFAAGWRASVAAAQTHGPDQLLPTIFGVMRLDEYTATRVLEMVVHHLDVRAALDLPPVSTPAAARITMGILEQLLGEPRPRNLGRTRFILAATGRTASHDPRFPVLR